MLNQLIRVPSGLVHVQWVFPKWVEWLLAKLGLPRNVGIVRTWCGLHSFDGVDVETGQPCARWGWATAVVAHGADLEILAMHEMPVWPSFAELQQAMASLGFRRFVWEHWHGGRKRPCSLVLPSASLPVRSFPSPTGATTRPTEMIEISANQATNQTKTMPDETTPTASFKLTLEVKGKETDTLTWENPTCPLTEVSARQAIILGAFADAAKRRASGGTVV